MRKPDITSTITWHGYEVEVRQWADPTDIPWEDCMDTSVMGDKPEPGMEGWDLMAEACLRIDDNTIFTASDSLGGVWGDYQFQRETMNEEVIPQALWLLEQEIEAIADGRELREAKRDQSIASIVVDGLSKGGKS